MKITEEIVRETAYRMLENASDFKDYKQELKKKGYSGTQVLSIMEQAKDFIKTTTEDLLEIQKEINVLRLNRIAESKSALNADKVKAVDLLNKMINAYTLKVELNKDFKFILGTDEDDWTADNDITEEAEELIEETEGK